MKKIGLLITALILMVGVSLAQDKTKKELRIEARELKKKENRQALAQNLDSIKEMVEEQEFALEANLLRGRYNTINLIANNNFIKVDGDEVVIQTSNPSRIGYNGLGGVTIVGRIMSYDVFENENSVSLNMQVSSAVLGITTVNFNVSANGFATANIIGNFGGRATFIGDFRPLDAIHQFEGTRLLF